MQSPIQPKKQEQCGWSLALGGGDGALDKTWKWVKKMEEAI